MTHTKCSNFVRIAEGLDVEPLLKLLDNKPELWKEIETRQNFTGSPHKDTESIYVRRAIKNECILRFMGYRIIRLSMYGIFKTCTCAINATNTRKIRG